MVGAITILNPIGRKKRRKGPRKMSAKQAKFFGPGRKKKRRMKKAAAIKSNPRSEPMAKKRRRRHGKRRMHKNPGKRRRMFSFRRNPITAHGFMDDTLMPSLVGVGGALLLDFVLGNVPLSQNMRFGTMGLLTRVIGAMGIGAAVAAVSGEKAGAEATTGALVTSIYASARPYLQQSMPNLRLARYVPMGAVRRRRMVMKGLGAAPGMFRPFPNLGTVRNSVTVGDTMTRRLGAGPSAQSKMRVMRGRNLGYIAPARQLGGLGLARYMQPGR